MKPYEIYKADLAKLSAKIRNAHPQSDEWWELKDIKNKFGIFWGQSLNLAVEYEAKNRSLEEKHYYFYTYLTEPYREWLDPSEQHLVNGKPVVNAEPQKQKVVPIRKGTVNIDAEVEALFQSKR